jgi:hypothetical protein
MGRDPRTRRPGQGTGALDLPEAPLLVAPTTSTPTPDDAPRREYEAPDADAIDVSPDLSDTEQGSPEGDEEASPVLPPDALAERGAAEELPCPDAPTGDVDLADAPEPPPSELPSIAAPTALVTAPPAPDRPASWGILCRVVGPGSVAGHGIRPDGRPAHFWTSGARGYFSQASIDKLPHLLVPESR